jgi:hypothetical protein
MGRIESVKRAGRKREKMRKKERERERETMGLHQGGRVDKGFHDQKGILGNNSFNIIGYFYSLDCSKTGISPEKVELNMFYICHPSPDRWV